MQRREMLAAGSAALLGLSTFPLQAVAAADQRPRKLLYFTRSVEYEHSVVSPGQDGMSFSGRVLKQLGKQAGFEIDSTKDGRVFDRELAQYDGIISFLCGDMFQPSVRKTPPMSKAGLQNLVDAVQAGMPLIGLHSCCYWGKTTTRSQSPYLTMVGAEFVQHGAQQEAAMRVVSPGFPGASKLGRSLRKLDEWYALKDFARDMHVILVQETEGMEGAMYQRPPFPATWARRHGKGRVFFTSMGHREDVWTSATFQQVLLGGIAWALGDVDADLSPNIDQVAPRAEQLPNGPG
jgi:hypothetical protein